MHNDTCNMLAWKHGQLYIRNNNVNDRHHRISQALTGLRNEQQSQTLYTYLTIPVQTIFRTMMVLNRNFIITNNKTQHIVLTTSIP